MKESIQTLRKLEQQLYAYNYALAVMGYDGETVAPEGGHMGRGVATEVLTKAYFELLVNDNTKELLLKAKEEAETEQEAAEVRELQREYDEIGKIPADEYAAYSRLCDECLPVWVEAKRTNNYALFAPYLKKQVEAKIRQAGYIAPGKDPYEVWLDQYERGLTSQQCDAFFAQLRETIVPLLNDIQTRGRAIRTDFLDQDWPIEQQKKLSEKIMELWGLDHAHYALGETEHPFTSGFWRGDVRMTTHYMPRDMVSNLYSVAHEGGHALYDSGSDEAMDFTVLSGGATMGLHESQSRLFENYVGRSRAFISCIWPTLTELFPQQLKDVTEEEFYRAVNRAEPSLIRTEADELTYCLHIMVRYELEKALLQSKLTVEELPEAWKAKYKEYLGVDVPDDATGVLQDIHWAMGSLGYFPSYALGSAYGAQAMADLKRTMDIDAQVRVGDLTPLKQELSRRLWQYGRLKEPAWLVESLCGGAFDPKWFTEYLKEKYTDLYQL